MSALLAPQAAARLSRYVTPPRRVAVVGDRVRLTTGALGTVRTSHWFPARNTGRTRTPGSTEGFVEHDGGGSSWVDLRLDIAEWLVDGVVAA